MNITAEQCGPVTLTGSAHATGLEAACACSCMAVKPSDCFFVFVAACVFVCVRVYRFV